MHVGSDGKLHATVEIGTMRVGKGRSIHQLHVNGNDISADVLEVDIHLDGKGNNTATLKMVAALVDTELAIVELTEETKRGLAAMGWRTTDRIDEVFREALSELENATNEADGRLDFSAAQAIVSDALADLKGNA